MNSSLLDKKLIIKTECIPAIVNPLTVSVHSHGNKRLILDLRHVNACLHKNKFKLEGINSAVQYCNIGDYKFKFDLKSGYHHLDIDPSHHKYLSFC